MASLDSKQRCEGQLCPSIAFPEGMDRIQVSKERGGFLGKSLYITPSQESGAVQKDAAHPNTKVFTPGSDKTFLPVIRANFCAIQGVVLNPSKFDLITAATAVADKAPGIAAYVKAIGGSIQVSPAFNSPARGPNCQAAIVVHEATHVVDGASGADPAHIPEWATNDPPISGKVAPGPDATFGKTGYDLQTPEDAIHNAAAYASFAAHVAHGKDERFGDGRQTE